VDKDKNIKIPSLPERWGYQSGLSACLHVTGEDALSFLQGQFTQELRSSSRAPVAYGLWLNQKGKVLADSFVLRETDESAWVVSFSSKAEVIRERLESYIIADDVMIENVTERWSGLVVGGAGGREWLAGRVGGTLPLAGEFVRTVDGFVFRGRRGAGETWEWLRPTGAIWPEGLTTISSEEMQRMRIAAGIPSVPADIGLGELPNEGGLEADTISYTKGCYLGQEVMARLKSMGQLRRKLVRLAGGEGPVPPVPCALLQGETRVGELRSAVADGAGGFIGLALVTTLRLDCGALLAPEPGGRAFIRLIDTP
jgi:folate-binding protein YgfZ